ncbi:MAG: hypothetical protein J2P15_15255 [Micromonosporaceae bacterium]|nr:hypothetical protein [Micromonosporaceae bacterium]
MNGLAAAGSRYARALSRLVGGATAMYVLALGMSGCAVLLTVALPPRERGLLVATTTSATVAVAVGGMSLETFLLARGRGWLVEAAGRRSLAVYAATVPLAAALAWGFAKYSGQASLAGAAIGAACLAAGTIPGAAGLVTGGLQGVYRYRAAFATLAPLLYLVLIALSVRRAGTWLLVWLGCQATMAVAMWLRYGGPLARMLGRASSGPEQVVRMGVTHAGAVAQIFTFRFDQLALSRYQGPDALAVYSLAINAVEFAQAGAVVQAQRALGDHEEGAASRLPGMLRRAVQVALGMGVLVLAGLAAIGAVAQGYHGALLLGALLLPRSVAVAVDKMLSARLVNLGRERATALIGTGTAVLAVLAYPVVAAGYGTVGLAVVSVLLFVLQGTASAVVLRGRRHPRPAAPPAPATVESGAAGNG